jgi:hypothetical protein
MTSAKAAVAIIIATAGALVTALGTGGGTFGSIDTKHWLIAGAAILGSGGVTWFAENTSAHTYIKAVVAFLSAGIGSVVLALNDNVVTQAEWITAFSAAVVALAAVYQIPNLDARTQTP